MVDRVVYLFVRAVALFVLVVVQFFIFLFFSIRVCKHSKTSCW